MQKRTKITLTPEQLTGAQWVKSWSSGPWTDNCVEVARVADVVAVRDSKDPAGPVLAFTQPEWDAFVAGAKTGQFDS
ncbi:MAG TPA: DUF397 domain-containing protein [Candidatus Saccharimonas sp.]|nr:DUF397 domain-containing protein [Candidatus Saccharimonas sp.]